MRTLKALFAMLVLGVVLASPADAHRRAPGGFTPSETALACIRGPWHGDPMESGGNYGNDANRVHKGAYQSNRAFEVAYAVKLIPAIHWEALGSNPANRANAWHPRIQDEMARNAIRARGYGPWSAKVRARCPR